MNNLIIYLVFIYHNVFFIKFDEFIQDHNKELTRSSVGNRTASDAFLHLIALARRQNEVTLNKALEKASNSIK
jgi:hypothetical protein